MTTSLLRLAPLLAVMVAAACTTTQSNFRPLGTERYPPKPDDAVIEIFQDGKPDRPFERIARIDVHFERTSFVGTGLDEALPEIERRARAAGADAVIEVEEKRSMVLETKVYHVSATAIRYTDE